MEWTYIVEFSAELQGLAGDLHRGSTGLQLLYCVFKYDYEDLNTHKK